MKTSYVHFVLNVLLLGGLISCVKPGTTPSTPQPSASQTSKPSATPSPTPSPRPLHFDLSTQDLYDDTYPKVLVPGLDLEIIAGDGQRGYKDGPALEAEFDAPASMELTPEGQLLIVDRGNGYLRKLDFDTQQVSTVLGGETKSPIHLGSFSETIFNSLPWRIVHTEGSQYLYQHDQYIFILDMAKQEVRLLAGPPDYEPSNQNSTDYLSLYNIGGCLEYAQQVLYLCTIPADTGPGPGHNQIYTYTAAEGKFKHLLGLGYDPEIGAIADFFNPYSDYYFKDGPAQDAVFYDIEDLKRRPDGKIYIADTANNRLRVYVPQTQTVTTLAGQTNSDLVDGPLSKAGFLQLWDLHLLSNDDILLVDQNTLRLIHNNYLSTLVVKTNSYFSRIKRIDQSNFYVSDDTHSYIYHLHVNWNEVESYLQAHPSQYTEKRESLCDLDQPCTF